MSTLRTFLPMLVLPIGIAFVLLIVGIARRSRAWSVAALAILYVSSIELVGGAARDMARVVLFAARR